MEKFNCLNCKIEMDFRHQTANKYCNNKCQKEYERNNRIHLWLNENKDWSANIPAWVKYYLVKTRGNLCEVCSLESWNNLPITLECDHIDGIHYNNRPENLRLICPNCHSQTKTYKNHNRGKGRTLNKAPKA